VLTGTAVVGYAAAAVWALAGIVLNDATPLVAGTGLLTIVAVLGATARRVTTAANPVRAAFG
jgi:hypothetical protein